MNDVIRKILEILPERADDGLTVEGIANKIPEASRYSIELGIKELTDAKMISSIKSFILGKRKYYQLSGRRSIDAIINDSKGNKSFKNRDIEYR